MGIVGNDPRLPFPPARSGQPVLARSARPKIFRADDHNRFLTYSSMPDASRVPRIPNRHGIGSHRDDPGVPSGLRAREWRAVAS